MTVGIQELCVGDPDDRLRSSCSDVPLATFPPDDSVVLNSKRRAALAEIDQADFS